MWHRFRYWVANSLHGWLWGNIKLAVIQVIVATVIEIGNIFLFNGTATGVINRIYFFDIGLTIFYFLMVGVSYLFI